MSQPEPDSLFPRLVDTPGAVGSAVRCLMLAAATAFVALALGLGYWQILRAPELLRRDDNPRLILAERAIRRGTIFDCKGVPLAFTRPVTGEPASELVRHYPEPLAGPLVGYYSLRHGVVGAEAAFDARLRGLEGKSEIELWWEGLLHRPQVGQDITLTLDIAWQRAAYQALGDYSGVVLVAELDSGRILAMVSRPIFDPNSLDADWEQLRADPSSPLLNRALQGQYQPGSLFQTVFMEEVLRAGLISPTDTTPAPGRPVVISRTLVSCASPLEGETWADVYAAGCPGPFAELAERSTLPALEKAIRRWRLDVPVDIGLARGKGDGGEVGLPARISESSKREIALGQAELTLTPLHILRMLLMLANNGELVPVSAVAWPRRARLTTPLKSGGQPGTVIRAEEAAMLRSAWQQKCDLSGLVGLAVSGPQLHVWYMGIGPVENPRYGLVILVEKVEEGQPPSPFAWGMACQLMEGKD